MTAPRRLLVAEHQVADADRAVWLRDMAERRARADAEAVHFWVFEHEDARGRFLEFTEGTDASALEAVAAATPDALSSTTRSAAVSRWNEVSLL